jgi:hypothetical protein
MIVDLGKITQQTKDQSPEVSAFDGSSFPPLVYVWLLCCELARR